WADMVVDFRGRMVTTIRTGLAPSLLALLAMVVVDACILLSALRFVGVGSGDLHAFEVLDAFLIAYPLTLLPLFGFGVMDAALLATFVELGGDAIEPQVVAALIIWRVTTLLGTLALGLLSVGLWKRGSHPIVDPAEV
ncbi:MAG: hypothetical protein WAN48_06140, partial [Actinomycetes bacterium]